MTLRLGSEKKGSRLDVRSVCVEEEESAEGLLTKLNPEQRTCAATFLLLSGIFYQVSVFST